MKEILEKLVQKVRVRAVEYIDAYNIKIIINAYNTYN